QGGHPLLQRRLEDGRADAHQGAPALRPTRALRRDGVRRLQGRRDPEGLRRQPASLDLPALNSAGEAIAVARAKSMLVALVRRLVGFVPYIGNYSNWLPIPYHFEFVRGEDVIGHHSRQMWKLRDVYTISMQGDPGHVVDRRLVLAIAVGMDALQAR